MIASGQSANVIKERLGHANISETFDTYGHLFPEAEDETRRALDGLFASPAPLVRTTVIQAV